LGAKPLKLPHYSILAPIGILVQTGHVLSYDGSFVTNEFGKAIAVLKEAEQLARGEQSIASSLYERARVLAEQMKYTQAVAMRRQALSRIAL
jgi:hypothetical protein